MKMYAIVGLTMILTIVAIGIFFYFYKPYTQTCVPLYNYTTSIIGFRNSCQGLEESAEYGIFRCTIVYYDNQGTVNYLIGVFDPNIRLSRLTCDSRLLQHV